MGKVEGNARAVHDLNDSERVQEQVLASARRIPVMSMGRPSHSRTISIFTCVSANAESLKFFYVSACGLIVHNTTRFEM